MKRFLTVSLILVLILSTFKTNDTKVNFEKKCTKCKDVGDVGYAV